MTHEVMDDHTFTISRQFSNLQLPQYGISLFLAERSKTIHFVRHAEGLHNIATKQFVINSNGRKVDQNTPIEFQTPGSERFIDAGLSERGIKQCQDLKRLIATKRIADKNYYPIELVVVSPFIRTLQTASLIFGPFDYPGAPHFIVHEGCRERSGKYTCDLMHKKSKVIKSFQLDSLESKHIDTKTYWTNEKDVFWTKQRESSASVTARAIEFLKWLANRPEKDIAVVTHSSFLRHLFAQFGENVVAEDSERMQRVAGNCEVRDITLCMHSKL